jgi:hypothetical protein
MGENHSARAHPEHVVLEIGGELGALVVYTDPELHGSEIEISRRGDDDRRSHKDVLERSRGEGPAFAAVFDRIEEGTYTLWVDGAARAQNVAIQGGSVTELDWQTS